MRGVVDRLRHRFLAGTVRADQHDATVGAGHLVDRVAQLVHRLRRTDQLRQVGRLALQVGNLLAQARSLQRSLCEEHQPIGLERLLDIIVGAALDGRDRRLDVAVTRDDDHREVRVLRLDDVEQRQPVELRALQPDVEEDHGRAPVGDGRQRVVGVRRRARLVPLVLEDAGHELADVRLVVDHQNV